MSTKRLSLIGSTVALLLASSAAHAASTITGTVTYTGKVPTLKPVSMDADPACAAKHKEPVKSDVLVLGAVQPDVLLQQALAGGLGRGVVAARKRALRLDQQGARLRLTENAPRREADCGGDEERADQVRDSAISRLQGA